MQSQLNKILNILFEIYLGMVLVWVHIALLFDLAMLTLHFMDRDDLIRETINHIL